MKKITQKQIVSMAKVVDMYLKDEKKHWEESDKPKKHIYHDLLRLRSVTLRTLIDKYDI